MIIEPVRISAQPSEPELLESWLAESLKKVGILIPSNFSEEPVPDWQRDPMALMPFFPSVSDYRCEVAFLLRAIADWIDLG